MSRWYKVTFTDGRGGYREVVSSGNTRHSAELCSRRKLHEEMGAEQGRWWVYTIHPVKAPAETGGPT
jgi:hypothetical protein